MRSLILAAAAFLLLPAAASAACPPDTASIDAARKTMLALPIGDGMQTDVSLAAQAAIAKMKDALAAFVVSTMECTDGNTTDAAIKQKLSAAAHTAITGAADEYNYGSAVSFAVSHQHKPARDDLLVVTASFQIECGEDTILMLFASDDTGWREVMRLQSAPYKTVAGGWGSFDYAISPPDASGNWFVAAKSILPWCSSTWSEIHYEAFRPTADVQKPDQILAGSDSIWFGGDDVGRLKVGVNYLDLRFHAESMDPEVHNREWIRAYRFDGDKPMRMPPFALNAADFADEWVRLVWADARLLTSPTEMRGLKAEHETVHKAAYFSYRSVRLCTGDDIQVEVTPVDDEGAPHTFFLVQGPRPQYFRMKGVSSHADPRCTGINSY
ncbi:MAG TPA: hypothetical protein VHW02_11885 [Rhizomicrobium sp.]|jgi:hypothetical protein|nr:hypothetical protein [Rhizomicrobium sp.]